MLPVAIVGADQEFVYSGVPFDVVLDGTASADPDGDPITDYAWTLLYAPPGSAAVLVDATTATPTLQGVDLEGSYRIFLRVRANGEWSEADGVDAPNSAYSHVTHKTQYQDLKIPANGHRFWADFLYTTWLAIDAAIGTSGVWDNTHLLHFAAGNDPSIRDNRAAGNKSGAYGLKVWSTVAPNVAGIYTGLLVEPLKNLGAGSTWGVHVNHATRALFSEDCTVGWWHTFDAAGVGSQIVADATARPDTGSILISAIPSSGGPDTATLQIGRKAKTIVNPIGTPAVNPLTRTATLHFSTASFGKLLFDLRGAQGHSSSSPFIQIHTNVDNAGERDFVLARLSREAYDTTQESGLDAEIGWDDGDLTWYQTHTDGKKWALPGTAFVQAGNIVRDVRPVLLRGVVEITAVADSFSLQETVALPAGLMTGLDSNDLDLHLRCFRVEDAPDGLGQWISTPQDVVVNASTFDDTQIVIEVKPKDAWSEAAGLFNEVHAEATDLRVEKTVTLPTPLYCRDSTNVVLQATPKVAGLAAPSPPTIQIGSNITLNASKQLTDFDVHTRARDAADAPAPTPVSFYWTAKTQNRFRTDQVIHVQWMIFGPAEG